MKFKKLNINPKGLNTEDCAVRGLALALNQTWEDTLMELANLSLSTCYMVNSSKNIDYYIKSKGWTKHVVNRIPLFKMKFKGTHVVIMSYRNKQHLTYVENGVIIDSWNCEKWKVIKYFTK